MHERNLRFLSWALLPSGALPPGASPGFARLFETESMSWVRVVPNLSTSTSWRSQTDYQYTREAPLLSLLHNVPNHPVSSTQYHA
jgi:hypothetical protein